MKRLVFQLDELDEIDTITHALDMIQLQPHTSTENILVWRL